MPGPLPDPNAQRRSTHPSAIPTTNLPASGYAGPIPPLPPWSALRATGLAWWDWAWSLPQAAAWSVGDAGAIARRASLEDDLETTDAKGKPVLLREMRELDDRLGLTPKGMAALRWKVVADLEPSPAPSAPAATGDRRARLSGA